jgi:hypothetical protein
MSETHKGTARAKESLRTAAHRLRFFRFSMVELLVALALLFFFLPFAQEFEAGTYIESILLSIVLLSAVLAVAGRRRAFTIAILLAIPTLAARWINHFRPDLAPPEAFLIGGLLVFIFVVWHILHFVLRAPSVTVEVLCASISAYVILGLIWTIAYWLVDEIVPNAFAFTSGVKEPMRGFNAFYFSFVTLSTVGYGDITPVARVARMLAALEAMTGLLYVAVLIARLVSLYSPRKSNDS